MAAEPLFEKEQIQLLNAIVEAHRRDRRAFIVYRAQNDLGLSVISHPGLTEGLAVRLEDIEALAAESLVRMKEEPPYCWSFTVTGTGLQYYQQLKLKSGHPVTRVEDEMRRLIVGEGFQARYPAAYQKWAKAEAALWRPDVEAHLSSIGHDCREATQEFASALIARFGILDYDKDPTKTVNRLRAVVKARCDSAGSTVGRLLDALIGYWGEVSDLIQRQEHAGQKEGRPVDWDDARTVVFQTLIVMFEIDRALSRA